MSLLTELTSSIKVTVYKHLVPNGTNLQWPFSHTSKHNKCTFKPFMPDINSPETIARILDECRTIAIVGLSSSPSRPSHGVAAYMQRAGYRILPVNPNETEVLGEQSYESLADVPEKIDLVDVFRRSDE